MNSKLAAARITAGVLVGVMVLSAAACGKKAKPTIASSTTSELITTTTTTAPTTKLSTYSGPLTNDQQVTWKETTLDQQVTYYAKVTKGEFLNIRKGPGTEYTKVGTLTRGQTIVVVARTSNGWYKTIDGFYASETYLSKKPPTS
ncbi:MAG: SH3 domain-containing protein [Saccharofermentans sp.]|nr:SH3 domain-containing protein [Saccharofermentans sp.]